MGRYDDSDAEEEATPKPRSMRDLLEEYACRVNPRPVEYWGFPEEPDHALLCDVFRGRTNIVMRKRTEEYKRNGKKETRVVEYTALASACAKHAQVVAAPGKYAAARDAQTGVTAVHACAFNGYAETLKALLDVGGADAYARTACGVDAFEIARRREHADVEPCSRTSRTRSRMLEEEARRARQRAAEERAWKRLGIVPTRRTKWKGITIDVDERRGVGYFPKILREIPKSRPGQDGTGVPRTLGATEAFLIISRAYEILSDDEARLAYDVKLAREARVPAAADRAARADAKRREARRAAADAARTKADAARNAEFVRTASSRTRPAVRGGPLPAAAKPFETRAARAAARQQQRFASKLAPDDDSDDASSAADHAEWSDIAGGLAAGSRDRRAAAARMAAELERYRAKFDSELADMMDAELRRLTRALRRSSGEQPRSADAWAALSAPEAPETPAPRTAAVDVDAVAGSVPLGDVVAVDVKTRKLATVLSSTAARAAGPSVPGSGAAGDVGGDADPAAGGWMTRRPRAS
ncbi:hypothetical protein JL720_1040 [Aureococcus anophagefferens]|nr:hypothetical protein JL720_1040 [Aureococcus anophagefferens]